MYRVETNTNELSAKAFGSDTVLGVMFALLYAAAASLFWVYGLRSGHLSAYLDIFLIGIALTVYGFSWKPAVLVYTASLIAAAGALHTSDAVASIALLTRLVSYSMLSIGMIVAVTLCRAAIERVQAANRRDLALVNSLEGRALFLVDGDGVIRSWNDAAVRLTGYSAEVATDCPVSILNSFEDALRLARNGSHRERAKVMHGDGTTYWAEASFTRLKPSELGLCFCCELRFLRPCGDSEVAVDSRRAEETFHAGNELMELQAV